MSHAFVITMIFALGLSGAEADSNADRATMLKRAQGHVNQASQKYRKGDYTGALESLRSAEIIAVKVSDPSLPQIRFNIGRCLEQLKRWDEALVAYEAYNRLPDEPHRKERAWEAIQMLRKKVFGNLSVACDPRGSFIQIEGLTEGKQSCPWQTERARPGEYTVVATHPGYEAGRKSVRVEAGGAANVEISLKRTEVASTGGIVMPSMEAPASKPVNIWPWVSGGGGVVALGAGALLTTLAQSDRDDAESLPPGTARDDAVSSFDTNRTLSYVMYGTGAALVVAGVVLWFLADDAPNEGLSLVSDAEGLRVSF